MVTVVQSVFLMKEFIDAWKTVDRNKVALILSVVPGLGHLYKHHYLDAVCLMLLGTPLALFTAAWLSFATLGISLVVVPVVWIAGVACAAYYASDEHGHHPWLHVWNYRLAGVLKHGRH